MIRKQLMHLLVPIMALMLVSGSATAAAGETPPGSNQEKHGNGSSEQSNEGFADASELAGTEDLSSIDPRNVYRVEDLIEYGTFGVAPPFSQVRNVSGWITAGNCTYRQHVDNPHWSEGYTKISVHGWWTKSRNSSCPSEANVDIYLQAHWCNLIDCSYINIASNSADVRAGGGSGRRVNTRNGCSAYIVVSFRGKVDVDLIGQSDPRGYTYSPSLGRFCYPD